MAASAPPRPRRRTRARQRLVHLVAAALLVAYVYAAPWLPPGPTAVVQGAVVPAVVLSGLALWKWPQIRTALRRRW